MTESIGTAARDVVASFDSHFRGVIQEHAKAVDASRSLALKEAAIDAFRDLSRKADQAVSAAVDLDDEEAAAALLSARCFLDGLVSELQLWAAFRNGEMDRAWDALIEAQVSYTASIRAHDVGTQFRSRLERVIALETLLFPRQIFMSAGIKVTKSHCSICCSDFGACDHVLGRIYRGEFANQVVTEGEPLEVSVVEVPDDKRCRAFNVIVGGVNRNILSWEPESDRSVSTAPSANHARRSSGNHSRKLGGNSSP